METIQTPKKIKHLAIRPTLMNMPVGSSMIVKYTEISSVTAFQSAVSRINNDKRCENEYWYEQRSDLGGILVKRKK